VVQALKSLIVAASGALALASAGPATAAYSLTGTASYEYGCGPGVTAGVCGNPDTGFLSITNTGDTDFVGTASLSGVIEPGGLYRVEYTGRLRVGQTWTFSGGDESSNYGGFNKTGGADDGLLFAMNGTIDGHAFSNSIHDKDIHSGVFMTNPYGVVVDNYILQGGDPFGRDTEDAFEIGQAAGHFVWSSTSPVPEPGTCALMLAGLGLGGIATRRKRATTN